MSKCTRFEDEGLLQIERGEPFDPHFDECEECRRARASYERLKLLLGSLDDEQQPADGWQDRVTEFTEQQSTTGRRSLVQWLGGIAVAAAIVVALTLNVSGPPKGTLNLVIVDGETVYRGTTAKVGDSVQLKADAKKADHVELRLYRDGNRLVFACTDTSPCQRHGDELTATATLTAFGEYQAVLLVSDNAIPRASGDFDDDMLKAREAGSIVVIAESVGVR